MKPFPRHQPISTAEFEKSKDNREARFGLPAEIRFCTRCTISNQRVTSAVSEFQLHAESKKSTTGFDEEGVCDACRVWETKDNIIDWQERDRELRDLCDRHRREDGRYDCIVPGSGGKDSFYQAYILKNEYGMHPLTVTWAPHIYTDWGWKNMQAWIHSGHDNFLMTPNGRVHRLLTRLATETMLHPFQPFVFGQKVLPMRMALMHDVKLVFYGDHPAERGTPKADANDPTVKPKQFMMSGEIDDLHLGGVRIGELKENFGLIDYEFRPYLPLTEEEFKSSGIKFHYLGYYLSWLPQEPYYFATEHGGFQPAPERTPGTYSKYAGIDDKVDDFNFYCFFIKFGIGRASYDSAQEIRARDINRDEGVALVRRFDGEFPKRFSQEFFQYISVREKEFPKAAAMFEQPIMDLEYFNHLCDRFRSPHLWDFENGAWTLRQAVWNAED